MQMLAQFAEAIGREMMRGEEFVISIDCDSVLPPTVRRLQKRASFGDSGFAGKSYLSPGTMELPLTDLIPFR